MKSKASIKGHPLHPMLVGFPIAFFTGTLVLDVISLFSGHTGYRQTASYAEIAGIIAALAAAVPGITDYFLTVPPDSSAKKRGAQHGIINLLVVICFGVAYAIRGGAASFYLVTGLELAGFVLLCISGWLGGTLVYRNQIGVDPRYAGAGKWKEAYLRNQGSMVEVAAEDELQADQMKLLHINGKRIVLGKTESGYVAFDDRCTHKGGSLAGGMMICGTVQCPWHGSQFLCDTGKVKAKPAKEGIATYPTIVKDGKVFLTF